MEPVFRIVLPGILTIENYGDQAIVAIGAKSGNVLHMPNQIVDRIFRMPTGIGEADKVGQPVVPENAINGGIAETVYAMTTGGVFFAVAIAQHITAAGHPTEIAGGKQVQRR